jgi:hypothetical protein
MLISGGMVTIDISQGVAQLHSIDSMRLQTASAVVETLKNSAHAMGLTTKQLETLIRKTFGIIDAANKAIEGTEVKARTMHEKVKYTTRQTLQHVYHMASQAWNLIEMAFGTSKNAASQMIGFAISTMTSIIAAGYAAASQWAAAGPWGAAMAILNLATVAVNTATQASMIASRAGLDNAPATIGNVFTGFPGGYLD